MKINEVYIQNVGKIESLTIRPKSVTVISGGNEEGKTTVLEAIRACFEGGHDPSLIRKGAKKGEVVITLDGGTTIRRTITPKSSDLDITTIDGLKVPKPQSFVETIAAGFSFDPIAFMDAPKKDRAAFLLSAMPVTFSPAEVDQATKLKVAPGKAALSLDDLAAVRKQLYETRTAKNRLADESTKTCFRLRKDLPEDDGVDWKAKAVELRSARQAFADSNREVRGAMVKRSSDLLTESTGDIDRQILELTERKVAIKTEIDAALATAVADLDAKAQPELDRFTAEISTAAEKAEAMIRMKSTRETINKMADEAMAVEKQAESLSRAIESIDEMKARKLSHLPIEGLVVENGEIFYNGVTWDRLSTAQKYFLCFQIVGLKAEPGAPMICDRAESFEQSNWEQFEEGAKQSGFQVFVTRVTTGPMKVDTAA